MARLTTIAGNGIIVLMFIDRKAVCMSLLNTKGCVRRYIISSSCFLLLGGRLLIRMTALARPNVLVFLFDAATISFNIAINLKLVLPPHIARLEIEQHLHMSRYRNFQLSIFGARRFGALSR